MVHRRGHGRGRRGTPIPTATIYVTEGVGLAQRRGGPIEVIRPGDHVFFEPGEDHWHGAAPDRFMTHFEVDDESNSANWGDHVTDEAYNAAPAS